MENNKYPFYFIITALISLFIGMSFGLLGGLQYIFPDFIKEKLPFNAIRPLHTLFVVSWILLAAIGGIYYYLKTNPTLKFYSNTLVKAHFWFFIITGIGIAFSYLSKNFAGKEYLEFPSYYYFPIVSGWILFGINYFKSMLSSFKTWPVYYYMWSTGIVLMIFHFTEAHLWLLPYFRDNFIQNIAVQWKAGGSYVGSWNMLVYGTALFVMEKISGESSYATSKKAFFFYFLGLTNLMFGWAHHVYMVPTASWIRYFAYVISMTEWVILFSIIYDWRKNLSQEKKIQFSIAYRFMILADLWVFLNIIVALLISIPSINLFTHGTHITVAHSMGTTIGINTLILFSSITYIFNTAFSFSEKTVKKLKNGIQIFHISFILFWVTLLIMGLKKSIWLFGNSSETFSKFQESQHGLHLAFVLFGVGIITGLGIIIFHLMKTFQQKQTKII
ncbi:cbb3-type cytochrome c oxidase subunit I [Flavobacterium sp.]|uniref:cbb3-type cytochrome c oxidase subunit I n=1 Tax=Flavobacterium sp. TaxID=239 RepID=UPI002618EAB4|nr:cbb3-type cytochrome c oxidase subunit I [Flavobacterium sp.]MDD2985311.1 cbb3-type cytochrome c oxidase subunit I [Flavobacterium sp.]